MTTPPPVRSITSARGGRPPSFAARYLGAAAFLLLALAVLELLAIR